MRDICGAGVDGQPDGCPNRLPCPVHSIVNDVDYHPYRCGVGCEVCADRGHHWPEKRDG